MVAVGASVIGSIALDWQFALVAWTLVGILVFLYRDARHRVPPVPLAVVSPANAMLVAVNEVDDPWLERKAIRLRLRLPATGPYSLYSPIEGKIVRQWLGQCTGPHAIIREAVCQSSWIQTDEGDDVVVVVHPRVLPGISRYRMITGERAGQGQRSGFMMGGGFVDILLPGETRVDAKRGQLLEAGADVVATLVHKRGAVRRVDPLPSVQTI